MTALLRNIVLASILALILFLGYNQFFPKDEGLVADTTQKVELDAQRLLQDFSRVNNIKIDTEFFADPRFLSLQDFRQRVTDEPVGRDNPFVPVRPTTPVSR